MPRIPKPPIDTLDLIISADLTHVEAPHQKEIYHFLYASTVYGTIFGIYGRFDLVRRRTDTLVRSINLRILNYHGVLNIGFERDPVYDPQDDVVDFWIQGASMEDEKDVTLNEVIPNGTRFKLGFSRVLVPMVGFSTSTNPTQPRGTPSQTQQIFDTEFHYRDGIDNYHQLQRDGMVNTHRKIAGPRCISSSVYLNV